MARLYKWSERAERKFNKIIRGVNPLCLLQHLIVLAIWERFNESVRPEYFSVSEVRARLESIHKDQDLGSVKMEDMFVEEDFSLNPDEFPECQNVSDNDDGTNSKRKKRALRRNRVTPRTNLRRK